jgi:hypothetical protein
MLPGVEIFTQSQSPSVCPPAALRKRYTGLYGGYAEPAASGDPAAACATARLWRPNHEREPGRLIRQPRVLFSRGVPGGL